MNKVCLLIPCLNEQRGAATLIREFRERFENSQVIVVDNCSTEQTLSEARAAGAEVIAERRRGKAQAVISALPYIDSDLLIVVDPNGRYRIDSILEIMAKHQASRADMSIGVESECHQSRLEALYAKTLLLAFGYRVSGLGAGLHVFSRSFYKNIPILLRGFELDLEILIQALDKGFRVEEVAVPQNEKIVHPEWEISPLRDFLKFTRFFVLLFRDYRPIVFFGSFAGCFFLAGLGIGSIPIYEFVTDGVVHRLSLPVLAASLMIIAFFSMQIGIVLEASLRYRRETYQTQLRKFFDTAAPQ